MEKQTYWSNESDKRGLLQKVTYTMPRSGRSLQEVRCICGNVYMLMIRALKVNISLS